MIGDTCLDDGFRGHGLTTDPPAGAAIRYIWGKDHSEGPGWSPGGPLAGLLGGGRRPGLLLSLPVGLCCVALCVCLCVFCVLYSRVPPEPFYADLRAAGAPLG